MSRNLRNSFVLVLTLALSSWNALAFQPANGIWEISAENPNQPGRGMQIEVQNNVLILSVYGYTAGGGATFYLAAGPMNGSSFSASLDQYADGTVVGGAYRPARFIGSAGTVTIQFSSGVSGSIQFPGEPAKAISKSLIAFPDAPTGLLGTWHFMYQTLLGTTFSSTQNLSEVAGATSTGSGVVFDPADAFACEKQISGILDGMVICTAGTGDFDDAYLLQLVGDKAEGTGGWGSGISSPALSGYLANAWRLARSSGVLIGFSEVPQDEPVTRTSMDALPLGPTSVLRKLDDEMLRRADPKRAAATSGGLARASEQRVSDRLSTWQAEVADLLARGARTAPPASN